MRPQPFMEFSGGFFRLVHQVFLLDNLSPLPQFLSLFFFLNQFFFLMMCPVFYFRPLLSTIQQQKMTLHVKFLNNMYWT